VSLASVAHILVVDDEINIATTLGLILQTLGYSVDVAHCGERALELAAKQPPDMLISDIVMPGIDGFELAIRLKTQLHNCGILLISGQPAAAERIALAKLSGYEFEVLAKPVHPSEIIARVLDCLGKPTM
jgi:DNA-binding response OmpR family regulator